MRRIWRLLATSWGEFKRSEAMITDANSYSVALTNVTPATLALHANAGDFKFV